MAHGSGIINAPLPIENLKNMLARQFGNFWVTPCLICVIFYACIITFLFHLMDVPITIFCMGVHMETKAIVCVNPTREKILSEEWRISVGFNHINMKFKRPKLEMPNPRFIRSTQCDLQQNKLHKWYVVLQFLFDQLKFL
jgi:hypothetical protein